MAQDPLSHVASWPTQTPGAADASPDAEQGITESLAAKAAIADDALVSLFRDWIAAKSGSDTAIDASGEDSEEYGAAVDRIDELEHTIADAPSAGTAGLLIKVYVRLSNELYFGKGDAEQQVDERLARSVLRDIVGLAPVLAPLVAGAIDEHAAARGWEL